MTPLAFTVESPPRTKKNHGQLIRTKGKGIPRLLPSQAWRNWRDLVVPLLRAAFRRAGVEPIASPVNVKALFYRDARRGDACNFYQGLADILQEAGVVADDKHIVSWDGSRMLVDRARPRVEVEITETDNGI